MRTSSVQSTVPVGALSNNGSDEAATESHRERTPEYNSNQRTPTHGIVDFDGNVTVVRARTLRQFCCQRNCLTFAFHSSALILLIVAGLAMMILRGSNSPEFGLWSGMLSLGVGGFLPEPKINRDE